MLDIQKSLKELHSKGWCVLSNIYNKNVVHNLKCKIDELFPLYEKLQKSGGVYSEASGTMHHICVYAPEMVELVFNIQVMEFLSKHFEGKYILNAFGVTRLVPAGSTYTQKIHRDARDIHSSKDMLNLIVILDESKKINGATKMLEGSHLTNKEVSKDDFYSKAADIETNAGDLIIFNPYVWHATGDNHSNEVRNIITPMVTRPYIKPGLDYCRALGEQYFDTCTSDMKQLFGYHSRVATSLNEYYVPEEKRMYRRDQT